MSEIIVQVPESWLLSDRYKNRQGLLNIDIAKWLEMNAPCDVCFGDGFIPGGDPNHLTDADEIACTKCHGRVWQNPIFLR